MMLLAMPCLDLCVYVFISCYMVRSLSLHAYMLGFMFFYVYVLSSYMFTCMSLCLYLCFHMLVCLDLCPLHVSCYFPCVCALYAMFACLDLGYVCHVMCYCSPLSLYLSFLCFGLLVWTRYRPCGLCHCLYTKADIKGFGSSYLHVYACLLVCFMLVLVSLVLGFATLLSGLCLCGYIRCP